MTHHVKTIPEALLKLKAALEEGKRDESTLHAAKEARPINDKIKNKSIKLSAPTASQSKWQETAPKNLPTEKHSENINSLKHESAPPRTNHVPKPHINAKPIPLSRNERVKTALTWLYDTFPKLFKVSERLPLKIGITHDVAAWIDAYKASNPIDDATIDTNTPFMPSKTAVRDAITVYTNTPLYQKALLTNDKRYDLDGNEVGIVEEKQKIHADQRNTTIEEAIHAQAEKREALRERRKMIAEAWRAEKEAKKIADPSISTDCLK